MRVDSVAVVVVRIRVLHLDDHEAWHVGARPALVEVVGLLLLHAVVTLQVKAIAVVRFQVRVGWRVAPCKPSILQKISRFGT